MTRIESLPDDPADIADDYDVILDAIFGFSFDTDEGIREPFDSII